MYEEQINLEDILKALRKRSKLMILCILSGVILSMISTKYLVKPIYEVRSKIFIGNKNQNDEINNYVGNENNDEKELEQEQNDNGLMYQNLLGTYAEVAASRDVVKDALENYGLNINVDDALFGLTITGKEETQILSILYTGNNAANARDIVSAVTNEVIKISKDIIPNVDAKIVQTATLPQSPIFPNKKMNIIVGMFLGAFIGIGSVILLEFKNGTYRNENQIENILGVQVLGVIPNEDEEEMYEYY